MKHQLSQNLGEKLGGGGARPHPPASPLATALAGDNHAKLIFSRSLWREFVYEVFQFFLSRLLAEFNLQLIFHLPSQFWSDYRCKHKGF